jgi:hypothetical protein
MGKRYVLRAILFYLLPVTRAIVFTLLAELLIGYMANAFVLFSPTLVMLCAIAGVVLLCALVLFVCSMYMLVLRGALMEQKARQRLHALALTHRQIELEKHRRELQRGGRRITVALNPDAMRRYHARQPEQGC